MNEPALVLIDVQKGFDDSTWGKRNNPDAEKNIALLLAEWRRYLLPVVHVQHCSTEVNAPLHPDQPGHQFKAEAKPLDGEKIFTKTVNSAFIGTRLEDYLRACDIQSLVIVGLTTDHCVSTSVRMAGNLGFKVKLVSDATATFDRIGHDGSHYSASDIHAIHLASLNGEFCIVQSTSEIISQSCARAIL